MSAHAEPRSGCVEELPRPRVERGRVDHEARHVVPRLYRCFSIVSTTSMRSTRSRMKSSRSASITSTGERV